MRAIPSPQLASPGLVLTEFGGGLVQADGGAVAFVDRQAVLEVFDLVHPRVETLGTDDQSSGLAMTEQDHVIVLGVPNDLCEPTLASLMGIAEGKSDHFLS